MVSLEIMSKFDMYLKVTNNSEIEHPKFAVYCRVPVVGGGGDPFGTAWIVQEIGRGNTREYGWNIVYRFVWSAQRTENGYAWSATNSAEADPNSKTKCAITFTHDGDFKFEPKQVAAPYGDHLAIHSTSQVPPPSRTPSSVGISIDGKTVVVADSGPNLTATFTLHPTYYIGAGSFTQGEMIDVASMTDLHEIKYQNNEIARWVTLNPDNTWNDVSYTPDDIAKMIPTQAAAREMEIVSVGAL